MLSQFFRDAGRFVDNMTVQQWLYALVAVILLGLVCLRGFGSRSNY